MNTSRSSWPSTRVKELKSRLLEALGQAPCPKQQTAQPSAIRRDVERAAPRTDHPFAVRDREPRTVYRCEVCDNAADQPPCPNCDVAICEVCRDRGALCLCWLHANREAGKAKTEGPPGRSTPALTTNQKTEAEAEAQARDQVAEARQPVEQAERGGNAALHGQGSRWLQGRQTTVANNKKYDGIIANDEKRSGRIIEDCRPRGHNRVATEGQNQPSPTSGMQDGQGPASEEVVIQQEESDQQHLQQLKEEAAMAFDSYRKAGGTEQVQSSGRFNAGQSVLQWWSNWFANTSEPREHYKKKDRPRWYSGEILNPGHYVKDLPYAGALYTGIAYVVH